MRKKAAAGCLILCALFGYLSYRAYSKYQDEITIMKLLTEHPEELAGQPGTSDPDAPKPNVALPPPPAIIYVWAALAVLAAAGAVVTLRMGKEPAKPTTLGLGKQ